MAEYYRVTVGAGTLRLDDGVAMEHPWTGAGVTVDTEFTGGHLLHLAVASCVLNDVYREAAAAGHVLAGVRVTAEGAFDHDGRLAGIEYDVAVDHGLDDNEVRALLARVEEVAEIPRALRQPIPVSRVGHA